MLKSTLILHLGAAFASPIAVFYNVPVRSALSAGPLQLHMMSRSSIQATPEVEDAFSKRDPMNAGNSGHVRWKGKMTRPSEYQKSKAHVHLAGAAVEGARSIVTGGEAVAKGYQKSQEVKDQSATKALGYQVKGVAQGVGHLALGGVGAGYQLVQGGVSLGKAKYLRGKEGKQGPMSEAQQAANQQKHLAKIDKLEKEPLPVSEGLMKWRDDY